MTEQEIIDYQLAAFHKYLSKRSYEKYAKRLLNDKGYFKPTKMAEKLNMSAEKFYKLHSFLCVRIQFRCHFYYKKK